MELTKLIRERRSVHQFEDRPLSVEFVTELLDTAVWVPNHRMTQPWRFVIILGEGRQKLAEIVRKFREANEPDPEKAKEIGQKLYNKFMSVPMFIAVVLQVNANPTIAEEDYASAACLIHNFSLLAWEKGIGMVWETYPLLKVEAFREAFGVKPGERIIGSLHTGYPGRILSAQERIPAGERLTVIE
ncbi:nitroreductase family protein [Paenibacillus aceris]|uniref:Putative NAD(P)H nitroreductase n=1 Tax=Paenibacillus aceris TaxID=869555 RepID=A0ABS4I5L4_9BACL|nr:nitroreductase [Paenibacillus aceris]MBP1966120.1 nitroreductase [Paenibacillus aceris]NHW39655.1 nitroreductase [Paenibacillus aceris]